MNKTHVYPAFCKPTNSCYSCICATPVIDSYTHATIYIMSKHDAKKTIG